MKCSIINVLLPLLYSVSTPLLRTHGKICVQAYANGSLGGLIVASSNVKMRRVVDQREYIPQWITLYSSYGTPVCYHCNLITYYSIQRWRGMKGCVFVNSKSWLLEPHSAMYLFLKLIISIQSSAIVSFGCHATLLTTSIPQLWQSSHLLLLGRFCEMKP